MQNSPVLPTVTGLLSLKKLTVCILLLQWLLQQPETSTTNAVPLSEGYEQLSGEYSLLLLCYYD
jgi:hypothetical protein